MAPNTISLKQYKLFSSLLLLVALILGVNSQTIPTTLLPETMENLLVEIDTIFFTDADPSGNKHIRKILRAAFHDCMGGCDSRINLLNTENRGLEGHVGEMNRVYNNRNGYSTSLFQETLSRPDFWALVQMRGLAWGIKNGGTLPVFG